MQISPVPDDPQRKLVARHGEYAVWYDPLPHRPYGLFRIYKNDTFIGSQLSVPCQSDCEWIDQRRVAASQYADSSFRGWAMKMRGQAVKRARYAPDLQEEFAASE